MNHEVFQGSPRIGRWEQSIESRERPLDYSWASGPKRSGVHCLQLTLHALGERLGPNLRLHLPLQTSHFSPNAR
jgi:hypothetical protein